MPSLHHFIIMCFVKNLNLNFTSLSILKYWPKNMFCGVTMTVAFDCPNLTSSSLSLSQSGTKYAVAFADAVRIINSFNTGSLEQCWKAADVN